MAVTRRHIGQTVELRDVGGESSVVLVDIESYPRGRFHLAKVRFESGFETLVSKEDLYPQD